MMPYAGWVSGQASEDGPTTSDLAERIKALRAASTVEATPHRTERKASTAEESITIRIRRRQEEKTLVGEDRTPAKVPSERNGMSFQERIQWERQQNAEVEGAKPVIVTKIGEQKKNPRSESTSGSSEPGRPKPRRLCRISSQGPVLANPCDETLRRRR